MHWLKSNLIIWDILIIFNNKRDLDEILIYVISFNIYDF